jgi:hypothetical protein
MSEIQKVSFTDAEREERVAKFFALKRDKVPRSEIAEIFNKEYPRSNGTLWTPEILSSLASSYRAGHPRLHRKLKTGRTVQAVVKGRRRRQRQVDPAQITFEEVLQAEPVFPNTKRNQARTATLTTDTAVDVLEKIATTTTFTREEKRLLIAAVIGKSYADGTNQQTTRN